MISVPLGVISLGLFLVLIVDVEAKVELGIVEPDIGSRALEGVDGVHLLVREVWQGQDGEVGPDVLGVGRLGHGAGSPLDSPLEEDASRSGAVLFGDRLDLHVKSLSVRRDQRDNSELH